MEQTQEGTCFDVRNQKRKTVWVILVWSISLLMLITGLVLLWTATRQAAEYALQNVSEPEDTGRITCEFQGTSREFYLYVPENAAPGSPMLFMLHGYGGNAKAVQSQTNMNETADRYGYVMVYPQGKQDPNDKTSGTGWNSGLKSEGNDDVGFLTSLANYLTKTYGYGKNQTFAAGFSNGAFMMYKLANEASDTFRAVASVAGFMPASVWEEKKDKASVGILQMNGTKDDVVSLDVSFNAAPPIYDVVAYWKDANGLDHMEEERLCASATVYRYSGEQSEDQVWYVEIENGRHSWPDKAYLGMDPNELIFQFFNSYIQK